MIDSLAFISPVASFKEYCGRSVWVNLIIPQNRTIFGIFYRELLSNEVDRNAQVYCFGSVKNFIGDGTLLLRLGTDAAT
jgi:hypothetical protein